MTYTTKAGDMWDAIAYQVYGTTAFTAKIMMANVQYMQMFVLPAGLTLQIPELTRADADSSFIPPWRR